MDGAWLGNDGLIGFGGGIPLKNAHGTVIGAVGVSGSSVDNDILVAKAAVEAYCGSRLAAACIRVGLELNLILWRSGQGRTDRS